MATSPLIDGSYALITQSKRMISTLIPNITVEEVAVDTLQVTDQPVETGSPISDHAFLMPCQLNMRVAWSDSSGGYEGYSSGIYYALLQLQASRLPFDVYTPMRGYSSMLITTLHKMADETNSHALFINVSLRNVTLTSTNISLGALPSTGQAQLAATTAPSLSSIIGQSSPVGGG
jgi:hypothetical protein